MLVLRLCGHSLEVEIWISHFNRFVCAGHVVCDRIQGRRTKDIPHPRFFAAALYQPAAAQSLACFQQPLHQKMACARWRFPPSCVENIWGVQHRRCTGWGVVLDGRARHCHQEDGHISKPTRSFGHCPVSRLPRTLKRKIKNKKEEEFTPQFHAFPASHITFSPFPRPFASAFCLSGASWVFILELYPIFYSSYF